MNLWNEIKTAALLGTERQPFAPTQTDGALGELLSRLTGGSPEDRLLSAASAVSIYRRAGKLPIVDPSPIPAPCQPEELPVCSPFFAQYLALMLGGSRRDVLPEAIRLLAAAGKRVPPLLLPDLLTIGAREKDLRDGILSVIGLRGRWLAARNAEWKFADAAAFTTVAVEGEGEPVLTDEVTKAWQLGSREGRCEILGKVRAHDANLGRALLESTWDSDGAEDKTAFLPMLAAGLSMADEPFLEAALDSRGNTVRRAALDLLVRIPESRLVQRMVERAAPLLGIKRNLLGKLSLEAATPAEFDKALIRDGVEEKTPFGTLGDKAWWLTQILAAIPPGHWSGTFREPPAKLIETAAKCEWADAVLLGWGRASLRAGDNSWIGALAQHWLTAGKRPGFAAEYIPNVSHMARGAEELILQALDTGKEPLHDSHPALVLLHQYARPWTADFSRAVILSVRRRMVLPYKQGQPLYGTTHALKQFAHRVPVNLADEFSQGWATGHDNWPTWQSSVEEFLNILQFRFDIAKEIRS